MFFGHQARRMALLSLGDGPGRKPWLNPQAGRPKAVPKRKGFGE